mmetsp:Transcript_8017/g.15473  ORF Transcript_8017/g.15473 Transcript_8017/m.15473 type:complete len:152 (+) Transcript_8017:1363-1818(+)
MLQEYVLGGGSSCTGSLLLTQVLVPGMVFGQGDPCRQFALVDVFSSPNRPQGCVLGGHSSCTCSLLLTQQVQVQVPRLVSAQGISFGGGFENHKSSSNLSSFHLVEFGQTLSHRGSPFQSGSANHASSRQGYAPPRCCPELRAQKQLHRAC